MAKSKRRYNQQPNIITRSHDQMTLVEKRALYLVINRMETGFNIREDLFKNMEFTISLNDLNETNHKRLREAMLKLQTRKIILVDDFENKKFTSIVPFPYVSIDRSNVTLKMMADVVPHFMELKSGFTKYELAAALSLNSVYSQKLYELCSRWKDKKVWLAEMEELKMLLNVGNYRYQDFRRVCLEPALNEISEKTDLKITYDPIKEGRKYVAIQFNIKTESDQAKESYQTEMENIKDMSPQEIAHYTRNLLYNYTFSQDQINQIMGNQDLFNKFIDIESKIATGVIKDVKNPTAYMAKSLFDY